MSDDPILPTITPRPGGTRAEHLAWCKLRSLQYVDAGDPDQALASMFSDLGKHDETYDHQGIMLGAALMYSGLLHTTDQVRKYIEGFN